MSLRAGLFIVFEGGDGAGKTTQALMLEKKLHELGAQTIVTREPGGTQLGSEIRKLLLHGGAVDPRAEALLYAADRAHHVSTVVRPALERGDCVIQDRYIDSSIAYQGAARTLGETEIAAVSHWATKNLLPHLTVLLDIDPSLAARRRAARDVKPDRLESEALEFHKRVRESFLQLSAANPDRYLVLDASATPELLHAAVWSRVEQLLPV